MRVILLLFSLGGLATAQGDAGQVLREVAVACRELYLRGYAVDIERSHVTQQRFFAGSAGDDRNSVPLPRVRTIAQGDRIVMAHSGEKLRFERITSDGQDWQWTTDGNTTICYRRDLNQFTETLAARWPEPLGPGPGLPGEEWQYFAKFLAIAYMTPNARILKTGIAPDRVCRGSSTLIELTLYEGGGSREDLRIFDQSHLPCFSTRYSKRAATGLPAEAKETIRWRFRDEVDPNLFVFAPRRGAKQVAGF